VSFHPLGVKGVGEIALVGVAPAIANAVFHATGKRVRELPITPDKLLWCGQENPNQAESRPQLQSLPWP
jgi:CO/xanthine dehydrogenase Mo-binding subunit